jgi:hypothetical protein
VLEWWEVTPEEVAAKEQRIIGGLAAGGKHGTMRAALAQEMDSVEREIAAAEAGEAEAEKRCLGLGGTATAKSADPGPEPPPLSKEAELDQVNEMLSAAGFTVADQFQRVGAPGSGVFYAELRRKPMGPPLIVRVQMLFGRPVSWNILTATVESVAGLRLFLAMVTPPTFDREAARRP